MVGRKAICMYTFCSVLTRSQLHPRPHPGTYPKMTPRPQAHLRPLETKRADLNATIEQPWGKPLLLCTGARAHGPPLLILLHPKQELDDYSQFILGIPRVAFLFLPSGGQLHPATPAQDGGRAGRRPRPQASRPTGQPTGGRRAGLRFSAPHPGFPVPGTWERL